MLPDDLKENGEDDEVVTSNSADESFDDQISDEKRATLLLIEARPIMQWGLRRWLEEDFDRFQVSTLSSPADAAHRSGDDQSIGLVLWSIGGLALSQPAALRELEQIKQTFSKAPIVLLADREDAANIAEAIRHGARGYIPTSLDRREIAEILRFIRLGGTFVPTSIIFDQPPSTPKDQASPEPISPFSDLTPRELEVVELLRQAKSNKVIAYDLALSESTVKVIVHRILNKLNAANRTEVACLALKYLEKS